MPIYKDEKRNTWYVQLSYKDWTGETKHTCKRGFKTKREASNWEFSFKKKMCDAIDMPFNDFIDIYVENMFVRLKESTMLNKSNIINKFIRPYFGARKLNEITSSDIIKWENEILKSINPSTGQSYSKTYMRSIYNQLNAMFNYAVRFYDLPKNPVRVVGSIGCKNAKEMKFWTLEQYKHFSEVMMDEPIYYYAFEILYWTGIREGELLVLTLRDIDLNKKTISISKTFHHINGHDSITDPKTAKSNRMVLIPDFLCEEIKEYAQLYKKTNYSERLFLMDKSMLGRALKRGCQKAGLPEIRVHDLRHSHVSLLIDSGFSAVAIADRLGHESIEITYRYSHMYPSVQQSMMNTLVSLRGNA